MTHPFVSLGVTLEVALSQIPEVELKGIPRGSSEMPIWGRGRRMDRLKPCEPIFGGLSGWRMSFVRSISLGCSPAVTRNLGLAGSR